MVMVSFFIGNDFDGRTRSLLSYSYALSFFKYAADRFSKFEDRTAVHKTRSYDDNGPTFTDDAYLQIERIRSSIYLDGSNRLKRGLAAALGHLREMKAICDSRGIRLMVVLIPDELQLGGPLQDKVIANAGLRRDELDFARPSKLLAASLNSENIDHLDLLDAFAAAAMRERLYKPNDSHWNIRGNQLAMRVIYDRLSAQLALPGD
jgi:hypothetical protein